MPSYDDIDRALQQRESCVERGTALVHLWRQAFEMKVCPNVCECSHGQDPEKHAPEWVVIA